METMQVKVSDGKFVSASSNAEIVEPNIAKGLGWVCTIGLDGAIRSVTSKKGHHGLSSVVYTISRDGYGRLELVRFNSTTKLLKRGFVIPTYMDRIEGTLNLVGGPFSGRYAYFRTTEFEEFLAEKGITSIVREDPNRNYRLHHGNHAEGICEMELYTDGTVSQLNEDHSQTLAWAAERPGTRDFLWKEKRKVKNATWAILRRRTCKDGEYEEVCTLYTLERRLGSLVLPTFV